MKKFFIFVLLCFIAATANVTLCIPHYSVTKVQTTSRTQRLQALLEHYKKHAEYYIRNSFNTIAHESALQKALAPLTALLHRLIKNPVTKSLETLKCENKLEQSERRIMETYHQQLASAIDKLRSRYYPSTEIPESPLLLPHDDDIPQIYSAIMRQALHEAFIKQHIAPPAIMTLASNPTLLLETIQTNPDSIDAQQSNALQRFIKLSFTCSIAILNEAQDALHNAIKSDMFAERIKEVKETINNPSLDHYKQVVFQHLPYNATTAQKVQAFYALAFYKALEAAV